MVGSFHVPSVFPGRLVRRIPAEQGDAWALFRTVVGRSEYYLRVPFRGAPRARYITARKWLNGRLALRFGLPVHPLVPIRVSVRELTLLGAGGDLELNDAGIFLGVAVRKPTATSP
ncbi:MAG: hypothetical protein KC492_24530, partial [Myxococcales bacterium]|nr:hypothetical protein [Myxococcales bacterium]